MKTIILDFDGTLADTRRCIVATMAATLSTLGLPPASEADVGRVIGLPLIDNFRLGAHIADEATLEACVETYRRLFDDICRDTVTLFDGVEPTLRRLRERRLSLCVASSRGRESLLMLLGMLGIGGLMDHVAGDEDVARKKPAPDMVIGLLKRCGTAPEEALVVGDTTFDVAMGQAAGCPTCGVTYGNHSRAQLAGQHADYLIDSFAELLTVGDCGRH